MSLCPRFVLAGEGHGSPCSVRKDETFGEPPLDIELLCEEHEGIWLATKAENWEDFWESEIFPGLQNKPRQWAKAVRLRRDLSAERLEAIRLWRNSAEEVEHIWYSAYDDYMAELMEEIKTLLQLYTPSGANPAINTGA
ncbi:hypothetical protein OQA88_5643 [Cercophora sp. LCS_1]